MKLHISLHRTRGERGAREDGKRQRISSMPDDVIDNVLTEKMTTKKENRYFHLAPDEP